MSAIPVGLCQCGCGQATKPARQTFGGTMRIGEPVRFVAGHNVKGQPAKGYRRTTGMAYLHRARAERALGHPLPPGAIVHHADGSRRDDAPLVICQDRAYHNLLHARMRVKAAGADPNTHALCGRCRRPKPLAEFYADRGRQAGHQGRCRSCCHEVKQEQRAVA